MLSHYLPVHGDVVMGRTTERQLFVSQKGQEIFFWTTSQGLLIEGAREFFHLEVMRVGLKATIAEVQPAWS